MTCAHEWRVEYVPVSECRKCRARQEEHEAFRLGAEAMRDAAANALHMAGHGTLCDTSECEHWGRYVRALSIPEKP